MFVYPRPPVEAAEDVEASVLSPVEVHAEDGGKDEQHHGEVEHHDHRGLGATGRRTFTTASSTGIKSKAVGFKYSGGKK